MSTPSFELACMGRAAVDLYGEQVGAPLEDTATFARYLGGSPANTAVGAARLGLAVAMITRVGDEQNGRFVRATLEREGVEVSQVSTDPRRLTALVFLAIRGPGDFPHVFYRDNCADMALTEEHLDTAFLARCGALLVSGTHLSAEGPRKACERAAREVRAAGGRVVLDIDYRPVLWGLARPADGAERATPSAEAARRIAALLPLCDLVVGTEEEFAVAGGASDVLAALRNVRAATKALLVVKLGPRGCTAFAGAIPASLEDGLHMPGFPVEVFNVLGAGDGFMAGFLRGWLRGEPLESCGRLANACGALVVSRHGCAPAMPSALELQHFLEHGPATPRVREDAAIEHLHRATTRRRVATPLLVLAFDHRTQFEALAGTRAGERARIPRFKALVAEAFLRVSAGRTGTGAIVDDRYGDGVLARLTGRGYWIARPVEKPGAIPLAFDAGDNVGLAMRAWPTEHVAKCLVAFHPDDPAHLQSTQLARIETIAEACAATGRELLLEIVPPAEATSDAMTVARALEAVYAKGVKPDWWKLPPLTQQVAWRNVEATIERFDPLCRGVLVLGMEAAAERLREVFAAAARNPRVRGFAVGRSIFAPAAEAWFKGDWNDAQAVDDVAARYEEVIGLWESRERVRETA
jgi:5-dehydro-2-deoxygluconokinase